MKSSLFKNVLMTIAILTVTVISTEFLYVFNVMATNLILIYILGVLFIARYTVGYFYGVFAAIAGSFLYDYFITYPRHGFSISVGFPMTLIVMMIVSIVMCAVTIRMKEQAALSQAREKRSNLISEMHEHLLVARDVKSIARIAVEYAELQLGENVMFYYEIPVTDGTIKMSYEGLPQKGMDSKEKGHIKKLLDSDENTGDMFYADDNIYYRKLRGNNSIVGIIRVCFEKKQIAYDDKTFIKDLLHQIIIAIELHVVTELKHEVEIEQERDRTKSVLLRAVSHDLRTPLTGILGQSTFIGDNADLLSSEDIKKYADDIKSNSNWLIRMVENLLSVTRISGTTMEVKKTKEVIEEIMAEATLIVRKRFKNCNIVVEAPNEPVTMMMDAILLTQVLINVLENAVKYSSDGSEVKLKMKKENDEIIFNIMDEGQGLPQNLLEDISQGISRDGITDSKKGLGLGLLICTTIVNAHGGRITARNRNGKGSVFTIILPES